ncbi:hypothetical protein [Paenibacillus agricola]|uniref:Uncharacterized protein n=1 Tax=Paenibacillus agricola TaxID=2716264 RepID=A0ABX0JC17_9BACL|nr:hypothetical protein [Paenibacillus agricola]NHN33974.1 hypothetical protein [Paenibacillus agricola]
MTHLFPKPIGAHHSREPIGGPTKRHQHKQQAGGVSSAIPGIMRLQATIGNRAVGQLMRAGTLNVPSIQTAQPDLSIQMMPKFKDEHEAILYFEEWETESAFEEHYNEVKQLLRLCSQQGWEDLQERIEYAQSQSEAFALRQFREWDLSTDARLPEAKKLLALAQDNEWDNLEDLVIHYVRKSEDAQPLVPIKLAKEPLLQIQEEFLAEWKEQASIPYEALLKLVIHGGRTKEELAWLQTLLRLPIPPLSLEQFDLLTDYKADLEANVPALKRVVDIVSVTPGTEEAKQHIELVKDFNYDIEFALEAITGAYEHAEHIRESELALIAKRLQADKQQTLQGNYDAAVKSLTSKERKDFDKGLRKTELEPKVSSKQQALSQGALEQIEEKAKEAEQKVILMIGPEAYEKRRNEYVSFFRKINYHPVAIAALALSGNQFAFAEKIVENVRQAPNLQALIENENITKQAYMLCLKVLKATDLGAILSKIDSTELLIFAVNEKRLGLLSQLHTDNVPNAHMKLLAQSLGSFNSYCEPAVISDFSRLLVHYEPAEIAKLMPVTPGADHTKLAFLLTLQPYAASAADLTACLELTSELRWNQATVATKIALLPAGQTAALFKTHIFNQKLGIFIRDNKFAEWINTLFVLMRDNNYTVTTTNAYLLKGGTTYERTCNIYDDTGTWLNDFVVHYHPGAKADVKNPNGSGAHIKPHPGNAQTIRIGLDSLKGNLKASIPSNRH